jgi:RNA polymerase sigma factor for flagellar operon FliA
VGRRAFGAGYPGVMGSEETRCVPRGSIGRSFEKAPDVGRFDGSVMAQNSPGPGGNGGDDGARAAARRENEAMVRWEPLVFRVVQSLIRNLKLRMELDDLLQMGRMGLLEAVRKYDDSQGVPFDAYATLRIRARIIDTLGHHTGASRSTARKLRSWRQIARVGEEWQAGDEDDVEPGEDESTRMARRLAALVEGMTTVQDLQEWEDYETQESVWDVPNSPFGTTRHAPDPETAVAMRRRLEMIEAALAAMPWPESYVIDQHYRHDRSISELAAELNLSRTWASRLNTVGLRMLRRALDRRADGASDENLYRES